MAVKVRFSLAVLVFSLLALCVGIAKANKDPELKVCEHQCKEQLGYDEREVEKCLGDCTKEHFRRKEERERETRGTEEEDDHEWRSFTVDPAKKKLGQCLEECQRQGGGEQKSLCRLRCQDKYEREPGREEEGNMKEKEEEGNPYVFEDRHLKSEVETEHGRVRVLEKFTKKSKLLRGLENIRVAIIEANPQTFIAPTHLDAVFVLFVAKGRGAITLIHEKDKQTFNLERGDVFRVPAGTTFYMVNKDENEKLRVAKILWPVNLPGNFKAFHGAGGEDAQSFFRAFSWELLEAALKTDRGRLERIFKQQQGGIVKASKEQIQALGHGEEGGHGGGGLWPFPTGGSSGPFNIFDKGPVKRNNYGQLFEAKPKDSEQLRDLDLIVSLANITRGSMAGPYYNSKATMISIVLEGEGYFEMACPRDSSSGSSMGYIESEGSRRGKGGQTYQRTSSRLSRSSVFIVPAGHPVATVASENSNLEVLCFEVYAKGNVRYPLAGKWNVIGEMDREAKELAYGVPAKEVDQIFGKQQEEFFFPGPRRQRREGRAYA
ncbi:vicilin Jug r 6.0101 [Populus alba]|uniref:Vicilin-like antimicrobial peptides 2-1 n=1 Tax=Populus alba TaxID=43335 RepID=A0A4U5Q206_POPAL|nr:sucrose-binding protein-like [Populus alba]TKS03502.1 vicilin-like antimicrobial peptides 2-1 [Populus alba]